MNSLCAGYNLEPEGIHLGRYLPALHQTWLMPGIPPELMAYVRAHEQLHGSFAFYRPAQMLPLRSALLGEDIKPVVALYADLAEIVFTVLFPVIQKLPVKIDSLPPANDPTRAATIAVYRWAEKVAPTSASELTREDAVTLAVRVMGDLLAFVMPSRPDKTQENVSTLCRLIPTPGWSQFHHLFGDLSGRLHVLLHNQTTMGFDLRPRFDAHTSLPLATIYLALSLRALQERPEALTWVMPGLACILTHGSFMLLPTIHLEERKDYVRAEIRLVHPTSKNEFVQRQTLRVNQGYLRQLRSRQLSCLCLPAFVDYYKSSQVFRISNSGARFPECIVHAVESLHRFMDGVDINRIVCPACRVHLLHPEVLGAIRFVDGNLPWLKENLGQAAARYEDWLLLEAPKLMIETCLMEGLIADKTVRVSRRFRYV